MNSLLMWIGGLLAAVLTALFAVPYFVDWNGYRGVFEEEASRVLGRDVRVGGDVNLRLLPSPYVRFEKLRIADASGLTGEPFFRAESFTMWLAVPPMLKGILEANKIELEKPVFRLAAAQQSGGNWSSFSIQPGSLPFVPSGVALQSVHIVDGVVSFDSEAGGRLGQIDDIEGELVATKLSGPYTFRGRAKANDWPVTVRAATTERDGNGDIHFKVRVRSKATSNTYNIDGRARGLDARPSIEGHVTAKLKLASSGPDAGVEVSSQLVADPSGATLKDIAAAFVNAGQPQSISGTAGVTWGARHLMVVDLSSRWLDLDRLSRGAPPRVGTGGNSAKPPEPGVMSEDDFERDAEGRSGFSPGNPAQGAVEMSPYKTVRGLLGGLVDAFPPSTDLTAQINVDQVKLGGDSVGGLKMVLARKNGPLKLETFRARLPGSARLEFSGEVSKFEGDAAFAGDMFVGGPSLARVMKWAFGASSTSAQISDGPFSINGTLRLKGTSLELENAVAEFSGIPVRGGVIWKDADAGELSLLLEGHELDSRWVGVEPVAMSKLLGVISGMPERGEAAATSSSAPSKTGDLQWWKRFGDQVSVNLKAGRLINGGDVLNNVDAQISIQKGVLTVPSVRFETQEGLAVELDGEIADLRDKPKGVMRWVLAASNARAVGSLESAFGEGFAGFGTTRLLTAAVPFRVAGKLELGVRRAGAADVDLDGEVHGGRLVGQIRLDGGLSGWRSKPVDMTVSIDSPRAQRVLELIASEGGREVGIGGAKDRPMRGLFKAVGLPASGMKAMGMVQSDALTLIYNGQVVSAPDGHGGLRTDKGEIVVAAADSRDVLGLFGIPVSRGVARSRVDGLVDFSRDGDKATLRPRDLKFGASTVSGRIDIGALRDNVRDIDADLIVDQASVHGLLSAFLVERPPQPDAAIGEGDARGRDGVRDRGVPKPARVRRGKTKTPDKKRVTSPELVAGVRRNVYAFSDQQFEMSALDGMRGRIGLQVGSLELGPGVEVSGSMVEAQFKPGMIDVSLRDGRGVGGKVSADIALKGERAGVGLVGVVAIEDAVLSKLTRWRETGAAIALAKGGASMKLEFSGRALSPRALVSVLSGKGEIALRDVSILGLAPSLVRQAADEALAQVVVNSDGKRGTGSRKSGTAVGRELNAMILERLGEGVLALGNRTVGVEIVDGSARFSPFSFEDDNGVTTSQITLDLGQLAVDSDWKIEAKTASDKQQVWPPVSVVFVGGLGQVGRLVPLVSSGSLERELVVQKLERNVNELERLRRLDEEAAARRREREKEREREAAAARALAAEEAEALNVDPGLDDGPQGGPAGAGTLDGDGASASGQGEQPGAAGSGVSGVDGGGVDGATALPENAEAVPQRRPRKPKSVRRRRARPLTPNDVFLNQF